MPQREQHKEQCGFFTIAQNTEDCDYVRLAYLLALSIKATQSEIKSFAVAVDDPDAVPEKYRKVFDYIIPIGTDDAKGDKWKLKNEWKSFYLTPFKETIKIEADMLMTQDIKDWWPLMRQHELLFTNRITDFRGNFSTKRFYRQVFDNNMMQDVYNGFMYFRYTKWVNKYFDVVRALFNEWTAINDNVLIKTNEPVPTTDVVMGVAVKIMNAESKCINPGMSIPSFVHMKAKINGGYKNDDHWPNKLGFFWQSPKHIKINSVRQHLPIHYHDKSVATDELISKYEKEIA